MATGEMLSFTANGLLPDSEAKTPLENSKSMGCCCTFDSLWPRLVLGAALAIPPFFQSPLLSRLFNGNEKVQISAVTLGECLRTVT